MLPMRYLCWPAAIVAIFQVSTVNLERAATKTLVHPRDRDRSCFTDTTSIRLVQAAKMLCLTVEAECSRHAIAFVAMYQFRSNSRSVSCFYFRSSIAPVIEVVMAR